MEPWLALRLILLLLVLWALEDLGLEAFAKVGFLGRQRVVGMPDTDGLGPGSAGRRPQHAGFERTFANGDLRKRDRLLVSRRTLASVHL
jgi:hypothetical protein